jgi:tellurite resistance protein TehA-like permease
MLTLARTAFAWRAHSLSQSSAFRVTSGGVLVSAIALFIAVYYATRRAPQPRTHADTHARTLEGRRDHPGPLILTPLRRPLRRRWAALSLGGLAAWLWQYALDAVAPSWHGLTRSSPWLLGYLAFTFTLGAVATHIIDVPGGPHRERVTGAFECVLRAVGLACVCMGACVRGRAMHFAMR